MAGWRMIGMIKVADELGGKKETLYKAISFFLC
jgi:DNA-binding phage protein